MNYPLKRTNPEKGLGVDYLKLTSCNTTGLIRAVDALHKSVGVSKTFITIIRRVADPGDTHRGLTNVLQVDTVPNHQAVDLMSIMPEIEATGMLIHTPVTHGHIITIVATPKRDVTKEEVIEAFKAHPRIRVVRIGDGFDTNTSLFNYARFLGHPRGDMYEVGLFEEAVGMSGKDIMFAINIPQESVTIPETIDAVRAAMERARAENPESALIIQAHPEARTGTIIQVRDIAYDAQMERVNIVRSAG